MVAVRLQATLTLGVGVLACLNACGDDRVVLCDAAWPPATEAYFKPWPLDDSPLAQGPATVASTSPFTVHVDDGPSYELIGADPDIPRGARVYVEIEGLHEFPPYGIGARFSVYALQDGDAKGALALSLWHGTEPFASGEIGDLTYTFVPSHLPTCPGGCGTVASMAVQVTYAGVTTYVVGRAVVGPYFVEATGVAQTSSSSCSFDFPTAVYRALITRSDVAFDVDRTRVECAHLRKDACIAEPTCALFGGGPVNYHCEPAWGPCEVLSDVTACEETAGCVWVPGDCACPDGASCLCVGDARPGCRTACETWSPCPDLNHRYCRGLGVPDATCGPGPGWCARRGRNDCIALHRQPVCSCTVDGVPQSFRDACGPINAGLPYVLTSSVCGL